MGIAGGLVKSVFSKSRSLESHDNNAKSNTSEKRRWTSVRSYLCGDELNSGLGDEDYGSMKSSEAMTIVTEFNSVVAEPNSVLFEEEDSSSVNLSEATVTQPLQDDLQEQKIDNLALKIAKDEQAAIIIQSAFRGFLARHRNEGIEVIVRNESPNRDSVGTSIEAQTGNSVGMFSVEEERLAILHQTNQKLRPQVIKEDWDDSTLSSNISRKRIQSRLEASTRRERALAYAFSQQLRVCSKKKEPKETNMGWNWLERWMATRLPESSTGDSCVGKSPERIHRTRSFKTGKGFVEEKESCGSNDVSVTFDSFSVKSANKGDGFGMSTNRKTSSRGVSRRKTFPRDCTKVKREGSFKGDFRRQKA